MNLKELKLYHSKNYINKSVKSYFFVKNKVGLNFFKISQIMIQNAVNMCTKFRSFIFLSLH